MNKKTTKIWKEKGKRKCCQWVEVYCISTGKWLSCQSNILFIVFIYSNMVCAKSLICYCIALCHSWFQWIGCISTTIWWCWGHDRTLFQSIPNPLSLLLLTLFLPNHYCFALTNHEYKILTKLHHIVIAMQTHKFKLNTLDSSD